MPIFSFVPEHADDPEMIATCAGVSRASKTSTRARSHRGSQSNGLSSRKQRRQSFLECSASHLHRWRDTARMRS